MSAVIFKFLSLTYNPLSKVSIACSNYLPTASDFIIRSRDPLECSYKVSPLDHEKLFRNIMQKSANFSPNLHVSLPNVQGYVESFDSLCKYLPIASEFLAKIWSREHLESPDKVSPAKYEEFLRFFIPKLANISRNLQISFLNVQAFVKSIYSFCKIFPESL